MGLIPQRTIDEIYDAVDIVEVISKFVELKKSGSTFKGNSPFTNEKTPSFFVIPHKDIYKCFSSGKGGNIVNFLMEHERFTYPEALRYLANWYNIVVEEEEAPTEFDQEQIDAKERMRLALAATQRKFRNELTENPKAIEYLTNRGITLPDIVEWQLGYGGNEYQMISSLATESGYWHEVVDMGICGHKNDKTFDLYRHRITIPINDPRGNLIGFGGRLIVIDPVKSFGKYINPKSSKLYDKSNILFGLDRAKNTIRQTDTAMLVEGYLDVIALHSADVCNVVASCGTALTAQQAKIIKRWAKNAIIIRDGDDAGIKAAYRDIDILVAEGLNTKLVLMPEGEDPDSFIRAGGTSDQLLNMAEDAIIWRLKREIGDEPSPEQLQNAVRQFCETILLRRMPTYHNLYIDLASRAIKQINKTALRKDFKLVQEDLKAREEKSKHSLNDDEDDRFYLPDGVDKNFAEKYGFFRMGFKLYFFNKGSHEYFAGSNFILKPLYHIHNRKDDKRLFELVREDRKTLLEIPSTYINQKAMFENALAETPGNFYFNAEFTQYHFRKLMISMGDDMPTAFPLNTLGQQDEGFFAFADGIATGDGYEAVDDHGMVSYTWEERLEDGSDEKRTRHFYLPAFSAQNKDTRSDTDDYENERKLQYRKAKCSFKDYCDLFIKAHGREKSIIGLSFLISAMYRDIFFKQFGEFPLMFCWGEKGSGKSAFAVQLQNFFFYNEQPFMLNAGTDVGFFRRLARVSNAINFFDEYTDHIDEGRFQALKSSWNGVGREKGVMSRDNRTETTKVRGALIVAGQYVSTRDDHSLTSRSILVEWQKQDLTDEQRSAFAKLSEHIEGGVSSLICDLIKHRAYIEANIAKEYNKVKMQFREALNDPNVMDRIINNYSVLQAMVNLLGERLKLPFNAIDLFTQCKKGIIYTNDQIADSEALSGFWEALQVLVEERMIKNEIHFKIDTPVTIMVTRESEKYEWENLRTEEVIYIRGSYVYSKYVEYMHRQRIAPLSKPALISYMRGRKKLWIGDQDTCRFKDDQRHRVWVINYSGLKRSGYELPFIMHDENSSSASRPDAVVNPYEPQKPEGDSNEEGLPF